MQSELQKFARTVNEILLCFMEENTGIQENKLQSFANNMQHAFFLQFEISVGQWKILYCLLKVDVWVSDEVAGQIIYTK